MTQILTVQLCPIKLWLRTQAFFSPCVRPVHWENMVELKTEHVSVYSSIMEFVTMFTHVSRWDPAILNLLIYCRYQLG